MSRFATLFPAVIDNTPPSSRLALWILGAVTVMRAAQSVSLLASGPAIVRGADGVPLETFPSTAAGAVVAVFAVAAVRRLVLAALGALVIVRYRSAVGLMLLVTVLEYLGTELSLVFYPLERVGSPIGPLVNRALLVSATIGLALVLMNRRSRSSAEVLTS